MVFFREFTGGYYLHWHNMWLSDLLRAEGEIMITWKNYVGGLNMNFVNALAIKFAIKEII